MEILYALLIGLALTLPFGPVGIFGAIQFNKGHKKQAYALASGACLADGIIAIAALTISTQILRLSEEYGQIITIILMAGLLLYVVHYWRTRHREKKPLNPLANFIYGLTFTISHPGNAANFTVAFLFLQNEGITYSSTEDFVLIFSGIFICGMVTWHMFLTAAQRYGMKIWENKMKLLKYLFPFMLLCIMMYWIIEYM